MKAIANEIRDAVITGLGDTFKKFADEVKYQSSRVDMMHDAVTVRFEDALQRSTFMDQVTAVGDAGEAFKQGTADFKLSLGLGGGALVLLGSAMPPMPPGRANLQRQDSLDVSQACGVTREEARKALAPYRSRGGAVNIQEVIMEIRGPAAAAGGGGV